MRSTLVGISLALCTISFSATECAFITRAPTVDGSSRHTALQALRPGKTVSDDRGGSANDDNECEFASRGYEMTPRAARIETPLHTLFGASAAAVFSISATPATAVQDSFTAFESTMRRYFPKAVSTAVVSQKVRTALAARKFTRENTLFGTCISPDEINSKPKESLSVVLEEYLSKHRGVYALGGIGGLPLQGVRGMEEFLSHCPRKGKVFLLFGPNVGISDNGTIGKIERLGQKQLSECCEPGLKTYDAIQAQIAAEKGAALPLKDDPKQYDAIDSQMDFILMSLRQYVDTPEAARVPKPALPAFITLQMFELGRDMILEQQKACLSEQALREGIDEVVILGGVFVNRGQVLGSIEPREDYFQPMFFASYSGDEDINGDLLSTDLFPATFGALPALLDFS